MVISCAAYNCTNRWSKDGKLQFHRFPLRNPELLHQWVKAIRRGSWQPTKFSYICSSHFTQDSYKSHAKRYLKNDAVPSIFDFPIHLKKSVQKRRNIIKHPPPKLRGWEQYVKFKASRIIQSQDNAGPPCKEVLTKLEERLVAVMGIKSVECNIDALESPVINGDAIVGSGSSSCFESIVTSEIDHEDQEGDTEEQEASNRFQYLKEDFIAAVRFMSNYMKSSVQEEPSLSSRR